jgi:hypothetical protein
MAKAKKPAHRPHKPKGKTDDVDRFEVSLHDALNLSALRIYMLNMERLTLLIYRTDSDEGRPYFPKLEDLLVSFIKQLKKFAADMPKPPHFKAPDPHDHDHEGDGKGPKGGGGCDPNDVFCPNDGLCHPPGDCS